jgi:hypothetical protein
MEPMLISESSRHRASLSDAVLKLTQRAAALRGRLPEGLIEPLSSLVREMNCYYSNLIEAHNTHPVQEARPATGSRRAPLYSDGSTREDWGVLQQQPSDHCLLIDCGRVFVSPPFFNVLGHDPIARCLLILKKRVKGGCDRWDKNGGQLTSLCPDVLHERARAEDHPFDAACLEPLLDGGMAAAHRRFRIRLGH